LEAGYLSLREVAVRRIRVLDFGVNDGGGKHAVVHRGKDGYNEAD